MQSGRRSTFNVGFRRQGCTGPREVKVERGFRLRQRASSRQVALLQPTRALFKRPYQVHWVLELNEMTIDPAAVLRELYDTDTDKVFDDPAGVAVFDPPVVAIAAASDPWFARFKEILGEFYWTPDEALALTAPGVEAKSVISFSLPIAAAAREANRHDSDMPARTWAYVRTFGEHFNTRLREGLQQTLRDAGHAAIAPAVAGEHKVAIYPGIGFCGNWSERHTAFVAGLGTFGIAGNLITAHGAAHRVGSVVTDLELEPTPRPYGDDPFAWCLKTAKGTCGACIGRCPAGSVGETPADRDKMACRDHAYGVISKRGPELFGFQGTYGCGLCQTGVPCEYRNPMAQG
jgi:epoxyqueuosine reductase